MSSAMESWRSFCGEVLGQRVTVYQEYVGDICSVSVVPALPGSAEPDLLQTWALAFCVAGAVGAGGSASASDRSGGSDGQHQDDRERNSVGDVEFESQRGARSGDEVDTGSDGDPGRHGHTACRSGPDVQPSTLAFE